MRRILRTISCENISSTEELGDLSTLANPEVVEELFAMFHDKHETFKEARQ
jgi:acetyl-CoA synthetase